MNNNYGMYDWNINLVSLIHHKAEQRFPNKGGGWYLDQGYGKFKVLPTVELKTT